MTQAIVASAHRAVQRQFCFGEGGVDVPIGDHPAVHFLPGKEEEVLQWSRETEKIRRQFGMEWQAKLRGVVDPSECLFVQAWESKEVYARWKASPERARLLTEASRMVTHDPTKTYQVL